MNELSARAWLDAYASAWEQGDANAVAELFTHNASYRSHIFRPAHLGRDAIRAYWVLATSTQSDVSVRLGLPLVDEERVAAEWWTTLRDVDDGDVTLPGCLMLRFADDGRCEDLREYWHLEPGFHEPYEGWGVAPRDGSSDTLSHAWQWIREYRSAWVAGDADAAARLYAEDVVYHSHPFRSRYVGRNGVLGYTQAAYDVETSVNPRFGDPVVTGSSAAIEYWTTMREDDRDVTLAGCVILRFCDRGLVTESRECWHLEPGTHEPPEAWGT